MNNFSIVIPAYNEYQNIIPLLDEISQNLDFQKVRYEVIVVDDCSKDKTYESILKCKLIKDLKVIRNTKQMGQSFSIKNGILNSKYNVIVTLDGDGQNNPKDIPILLKNFNKHNVHLVGGIRYKRKDKLIKILSSIIANYIRRLFLNDDCLDTGCALKVFDKETFLKFPFFNGIHRFLPALFKGYGKKTMFINVDHRERVHGVSKYGTIKRGIIGIKDMIRVIKIINNFKYDL